MSYLGKEFTSIFSHNENINLETAKVLFAPNMKLSVIYSPSVILCLDLNTKEVVSKFVFAADERVSNVKITQSNRLTYIKEKKMNPLEIVTLNFNGHSEYSELKLQQRVIEYESWLKGGIDYLFVINDNYELMLYKDNQLYIKQNISHQLQVSKKHHKPIAKMEFIANSDMLLLITSQGDIYSYYINDDAINMNQNPSFNLIENALIASDFNENVDLDIVSIKQTSFICFHLNPDVMDIIEEEPDENDSIHNNDSHSYNLFLTVISNVNRADTVISFFELKNMRLIPQKELVIQSKTCIDSFISKYSPSTLGIGGGNDHKPNIPIFMFVCLKAINSFEFYYIDLLDCFGKKIRKQNENKVTLAYLNSLTGDISNIQKISFINTIITLNKTIVMNTQNTNSNIFPSINLRNIMKLNIKIFRRINEYECYLTNEIISEQLSTEEEDEDEDEDEEEEKEKENNAVFKGAFSTDVNQYLNFYYKERNSLDNISLFRDNVFQLIAQDKLLFDTSNPLLDIRNCNIDPYLILLIYNNSLLAIKKYLNTKDNYNYNQFLVSTDVLFETIKVIYNNLRKKIEKGIKRDKSQSDLHKKGIMYMKLLIEILKLIRHRNAHPIGQPYIMETDLQTDEGIIIDTYIFDMEVMLMMIKIENECIENSINTDALNKINDKDYSYIKIINLNYHQLQSLNSNKQNQMTNSLSEIFANYFTKCSIESLILFFLREKTINLSLEGLIYYMKFMFFNYYYYLVSLKSLDQGIISNSKIFRSLFTGVIKEYNEYNDFSQNFFSLDQNKNSEIAFDTFSINQFLLKLNQFGIIHNQAFKELLSDDHTQTLHAVIIDRMINDGYITEAYTISNSLSCYYNKYEEWINHVFVLLKLKMFNLAWQAITHFFSNDYLTLQMSQISQSNLSGNEKIQSLIKSDKYPAMKSMHSFFYKFLIENGHLDILFTLPLTFFEKYILKNFLLESNQYEELLIVYYAKYRRVKEADQCFKDYLKKSSFGKESSKGLYKQLLDSLFYLFGNENEKRSQLKDNNDISLRDIKVNSSSLFIECDINKEQSNMISINDNPSFINSRKKSPMIAKTLFSDSVMNKEKVDIRESFMSRRGEEMNESMKDGVKASIMKTSDISIGVDYIHSDPVKVHSYSFFTNKK